MGKKRNTHSFDGKARMKLYEDLGVCGRILKWILKIQDEVVWTGFTRLKMGTSRKLLWTW
jgi:hypothetical protein